jgi:hypothetical protein
VNPTTDQSIRELVKQLGNDASLLVRQEAELARREIDDKIAVVKKEAMAIAAGAAVAYAGMLAISAGIILALSLWMAAWVAALIVGVALVGGGGALLLIAKFGLKDFEPLPKETLSSVRADIHALQHATR